jgi:hypothetical protein
MAAKDGDSLCGKCGEEVEEKGLQCDACGKWVHCKCADMHDQLYKAIGKFKCSGIRWFCGSCGEAVGKFLGGLGGLGERQDKMEAEMVEIRKELEGMKKEIGKEQLNFSGALKKNLTQEEIDRDKGKPETVSGRAAERDFQMQVTEAMERDKRRKNIMIMGVPEQDEEKTKEFVKVLLDDLLKEEVEHTVIGRVGRVDGAKVRPVRISIEKADMKRNILKHASLLKAETKYEKVYVSPDLTRIQQEEDKKLRDMVKEYRRQGMTGVKISRGEVVREEDSGRVVLFSQTK